MAANRIAWATAIIATATALALAGAADGAPGITKKVQKAFRGQILLTDAGGLPQPAATPKATIALFKKARVTTIKRDGSGSSSPWTFHYTAFMKNKPKTTALSFDFYTDDKDKNYVANKRVILPNAPSVFEGKFELTEDDGLNPRRKYVLKLAGEVKGKEVVYATTKIELK